MRLAVSALVFAVGAGSASAQWQAGFDTSRLGLTSRAVEVDSQGDIWALETMVVTASQPGFRVARFSPTGLESWTSPITTLSQVDSYYAFSSGGVGPFATVAYRNFDTSGVMRVDAAGSIVWHNNAWGITGFQPKYLVDEIPVGASGECYVTCAAYTSAATGYDFAVLSFDALGALRWTRFVDGGASGALDYPRDIALDGFGGLYVCGTWNETLTTGGTFALTRLDVAGNVLWSRSFAGAGGGGVANAVAVDAAGNAYVAGVSTSGTEALLVKWDTAGNLVWSRAHSIGIGALYNDVAVDAAGTSFATGTQYVGTLPFPSSADVLTDARAANGDLLWHDVWNWAPTGAEAGQQISLDAGGRATVVGSNSSTLGSVTLVGRFERDGTPRWTTSFNPGEVNLPLDSDAGLTGNVVLGLYGYSNSTGVEGHLVEVRDQSNAFCFGDASSLACPCGNNSVVGAATGCLNASGSGARLTDSGVASVSADSLALEGVGMPPGTICLFVQGGSSSAPVVFGDGLRCASGALKRLYVSAAPTGSVEVPGLFGTSVSVRSAAEGDVLAAGSTRSYQIFYRDADATFCTSNTFNMSSGLSIAWAP